jgi:hypothetical protein
LRPRVLKSDRDCARSPASGGVLAKTVLRFLAWRDKDQDWDDDERLSLGGATGSPGARRVRSRQTRANAENAARASAALRRRHSPRAHRSI